VRCGYPYKATGEDSRLGHLKSALNIRLYYARGATPTRMDVDCNFNAPAKGSFAISRLGLIRGTPTRDQRRHISEAVNKDNYRDRAESGLRALEISKHSIEPMSGIYRKEKMRAVTRSNSMMRRRRPSELSTVNGTEPNSESTRSDSPEFGRKNAMSLEEKAAAEVRQQAIAYSARARARAREERNTSRARGRAASEPARDEANDLERKPSFMRAQRQLLEQLKEVDQGTNVAKLMGDEEADKAAVQQSPKQSAHDWLSRVMAASLVADEGQDAGGDAGTREKALARARAISTPGPSRSFDRKQKLSRARAAKSPNDTGEERGRSLSFSRTKSMLKGERTRSFVSSASRSLSFESTRAAMRRTLSFEKGPAKTPVEKAEPTQADLLRAAASSYAQNHRLNSRVPGSDGLDPTTSALFEARTMNVALPPPLISTGKDDGGAAEPESPRVDPEDGEPFGMLTPPVRPSMASDASNSAHERVGRAKRDSVSRARAAGVPEDPTKIQARHKYEGMAAEAAELAKHRSFTRSSRVSVGSSDPAIQPDGRGSWTSPETTPIAAPDHACEVDMDRVTAAAVTASAGTASAEPRPVKWRPVGATPTSAGETKGPSPRQNKILQI